MLLASPYSLERSKGTTALVPVPSWRSLEKATTGMGDIVYTNIRETQSQSHFNTNTIDI
jgi:hypothetical protein